LKRFYGANPFQSAIGMTAGQGALEITCGKIPKHTESAGYTRIRVFVNLWTARRADPSG
jgi:hypothetical protein